MVTSYITDKSNDNDYPHLLCRLPTIIVQCLATQTAIFQQIANEICTVHNNPSVDGLLYLCFTGVFSLYSSITFCCINSVCSQSSSALNHDKLKSFLRVQYSYWSKSFWRISFGECYNIMTELGLIHNIFYGKATYEICLSWIKKLHIHACYCVWNIHCSTATKHITSDSELSNLLDQIVTNRWP